MWELQGVLPGKNTQRLGFPWEAGLRSPGHPWPEGAGSSFNPCRSASIEKPPREDPVCAPIKPKPRNKGRDWALRIELSDQEEFLAPTMTTPYLLTSASSQSLQGPFVQCFPPRGQEGAKHMPVLISANQCSTEAELLQTADKHLDQAMPEASTHRNSPDT